MNSLNSLALIIGSILANLYGILLDQTAWNTVMPTQFNLPYISYAQAFIAFFTLRIILFGDYTPSYLYKKFSDKLNSEEKQAAEVERLLYSLICKTIGFLLLWFIFKVWWA